MLQLEVHTRSGEVVMPPCMPYRDSAGGAWVVANLPGEYVAVPATSDLERADDERESMICSAETLEQVYTLIESMVACTSVAGMEAWFREMCA